MATEMDDIVAPAAYVQALRNNRILSRILITLVLLLIGTIGSIIGILPLKEKELQVVEYQRDTNVFVKVLKPNKSIQDYDVVQALFLRQYVEAREAIDKITELERYQTVYKYSSKEVWDNFNKTHGAKSSLYYQKGMKREIQITRDSKLSKTVHQIEFKTIDTKDGDVENKKWIKEWVVTLRYENHSQKVNYDDRYSNPLGTQVIEYSYSKRK